MHFPRKENTSTQSLRHMDPAGIEIMGKVFVSDSYLHTIFYFKLTNFLFVAK